MSSRNFECDRRPGLRLITRICSTSGWLKHSSSTPSPTMPVAPQMIAFIPRPTNTHYRMSLSSYVVAIGTDGYQVVYALADLDPSITTSAIILADRTDGESLDAN